MIFALDGLNYFIQHNQDGCILNARYVVSNDFDDVGKRNFTV
nr:MAG TPA: hypothetical protein [Caudoviricetes sp.]